ncbi:MAG TPA: tungstate ABC transporter substrate-binding protein WtpA [Dehalococcoidia bacterium]|nr:tungstate ABC transporter substrate-binding protein WtpA [Dehalococcoidia bacterium]
MTRIRTKLFSSAIALLVALVLVPGCAQPAPTEPFEGTLAIYHAGSLAVPFEDMATEFNKIYPNVNIERDSGGSRTEIRKITELGKIADILASADYALIPDMMYPEFADWYIVFAHNKMVIAYTDTSKFADEINKDNWHEVLTRDGVVYGHSDPNQDPCGYRTLMVWQLAEDYYKKPGLYAGLDIDDIRKNVTRPKSVDLIALLESGDMDYAFEYLSVAKQHDLKFVELPEEIDLSSVEFEDFYATAEVEVTGEEPGTMTTLTGMPIVYGLTIPKNASRPDLATAFLEFLLGKDGQVIMENNGQPPIVPAVTDDKSKLPSKLRDLCVEAK